MELLGHDGISEASKSVHPSGNPMSHSTHIGFSWPPMTVGSSVFALGRLLSGLVSGDLKSLAVGVGNSAAFCDNKMLRVAVASWRRLYSKPRASIAVGVGHSRTALAN